MVELALLPSDVQEEVKSSEVTVIDPTTTVHPLLATTQNRAVDDEAEREDNMVVVVEHEGIRYRVDFSRYGTEYQLMPRAVKKEIALEDIKLTVAEKQQQEEKERALMEQYEKHHANRLNQIKQEDRKMGMVERMRAKLLKKNPLRKDVKQNDH